MALLPQWQMALSSFRLFTLEIGPQPVGQHRNAQLVRNLAELEYLVLGQKLGFVNQYTVQRFLGVARLCESEQIAVFRKGRRFGLDTDARGHLAGLIAVVERRRQHQRPHTPFFIVVAGLQQARRLAGIH